MSPLEEQLSRLADDAPPATPDPGLWDCGRRWQRRRRGGTTLVAVAAVLALVAIGALSWQRAQPPVAVPPSGQPGLPDRVFEPSPWLPGTEGDGPLGPIAVIMGAERRGWGGATSGTVAVSATTGDYRFLDLPGAVDAALAEPVLSPDGAHIAYWLTGTTEESPNTDSGPLVGVAVYDTVTGGVRRHLIPTAHGVRDYALAWADAETLVLGYGQLKGGDGDPLMDQGFSLLGPTLVWRIEEPEPVALDVDEDARIEDVGPGYAVLAATAKDRAYRIVDLDGTDLRQRFALVDDTSTPPVLGAGGQRIAVVSGEAPGDLSGANPNVVLVGTIYPGGGVGPPRSVRLRPVPGSGRTFAVLGWADDHRVVLVQRAGRDKRPEFAVDVNLVDVRDGTSTRLVEFPGQDAGQLATDLVTEARLPGREPPRPLDPRVAVGSSAAVVMVAVIGLVAWRRRVRV